MSEIAPLQEDTAEHMMELFQAVHSAHEYRATTEVAAGKAEDLAEQELDYCIHGSGLGYDNLRKNDFLSIGKKFAKSEVLHTQAERALRDREAIINGLFEFMNRNHGRLVVARSVRLDSPTIKPAWPISRARDIRTEATGLLNRSYSTIEVGISVHEKRLLRTVRLNYQARVLNDEGHVVTRFEFPESS